MISEIIETIMDIFAGKPIVMLVVMVLTNAGESSLGTKVINSVDQSVFDALLSGTATSSGLIDASAASAVGGAIGTIMSGMKGVGMAITTMFFIFTFIEMSSQTQFTLDMYIKHWTKFIAALAVIIESNRIVQLGYAISAAIGARITNVTNSTEMHNVIKADVINAFLDPGVALDASLSGEELNTALRAIKMHDYIGVGFMGGLTLLLSSVIVWLVAKVAYIVVMALALITLLSRTLEIVVRAVFLPIAMGMWSDDGWHGSAGRYIKRLCGLFIQGPAISILLFAYTRIVGTFVNSCFSGLLSIVPKYLNNGAEFAAEQFTGAGLSALGLVGSVVVTLALCVATIGALFRLNNITSDVFGG